MKMRQTATHVYFVGGPFSQWYPSRFRAALERRGEEFEFNCCEQYMMAAKAHLMGDQGSVERILAIQPKGGNAAFFDGGGRGAFIEVPKAQKAAGREVTPFDPELWDKESWNCVFVGNYAKFTQNLDLGKTLLDTGERTLVEGASYDRIWGVGIDWADPRIEDEANWRGENRLGLIEQAIRHVLHNGTAGFDPFVRAYLE